MAADVFGKKKTMQKVKFEQMVPEGRRTGKSDWSYTEKREKFLRKMEEKFEFGTGCYFSVKKIPLS